MKTMTTKTTCIFLALIMMFSLVSCGKTKVNDALWQNALYTQDTEFGKGNKTVQVEVKTDEYSVTFTVKTDKALLGDALLENNLVDGENGPYGLYIKSVNGIVADYDIDQSYWAFYKDGEMMMTGVDGAEIADGEHYELVYTK